MRARGVWRSRWPAARSLIWGLAWCLTVVPLIVPAHRPVVALPASGGPWLLRSIAVGQAPSAVAVDPATGRLFVALWGALAPEEQPSGPGQVTLLDPRTGNAVRTIYVGRAPSALVLDPRSRHVFVLNEGAGSAVAGIISGSVSLLDARDSQLLHTEPLAQGPLIAAVDEGRRRVYVADTGGLHALDLDTGRVRHSWPYRALLVDPDRGRLLDTAPCMQPLYGQVMCAHVRDLATGRTLSTDTTNFAEVIASAALDGRAGRFLIEFHEGKNSNGRLHVLDAVSGHKIAAVPAGSPSATLAVDERLHRAVLASAPTFDETDLNVSCSVVVLSTLTGASIGPATAWDCAGGDVAAVVDPTRALAYVTTAELTVRGADLRVVDLRTGRVRRPVRLGYDVRALALDPWRQRLYAADWAPAGILPDADRQEVGAVYVIDTARL